MTTKQVHIGDILTITTGRLVSNRHMDGVYDILNWLTNDNLFTHQLPRAADECAPFLREQFPDLAEVRPPDDWGTDPKAAVEAWLAAMVALHGETRDVPRLPQDGTHARIDPILELNHMVGADRVIPVVVEP